MRHTRPDGLTPHDLSWEGELLWHAAAAQTLAGQLHGGAKTTSSPPLSPAEASLRTGDEQKGCDLQQLGWVGTTSGTVERSRREVKLQDAGEESVS